MSSNVSSSSPLLHIHTQVNSYHLEMCRKERKSVTSGLRCVDPKQYLHFFKVPMKCKINAAYLTGFSKKKNNDVFLFGISFFVLEILFVFFYYAN